MVSRTSFIGVRLFFVKGLTNLKSIGKTLIISEVALAIKQFYRETNITSDFVPHWKS